MTDSCSLIRIVQSVQPDEIYNLAAQTATSACRSRNRNTPPTPTLGTLRLLEAIRILAGRQVALLQASTSELYGLVQETPQRETTPFPPRRLPPPSSTPTGSA